MLARIGTSFKNYSYFSLFFWALSLTIKLKVLRSRAQSSTFVLAVIVAALGALYKSDSSPKASPGWYSFK